jgi:uncharacterized protein (DUF1684 family)
MKRMKAAVLSVLIIVMVFFVQSCTSAESEKSAAVSGDAEWKQALLKERSEKDEELKKFPNSHMARSKRLEVLPDRGETFILETAADVLLTDKKEETDVKLSVINRNGEWFWSAIAPGVTCTADEKEVAPQAPLPSRVTFKLERCVLTAYISGDRLLLMVYDPERAEFKHFSHLYYFPPDRTYAVPAVLEIFPTIETFKVFTTQKEERLYHRYAYVHFQLDGKPYRLTVFKFSLDKDDPESEILFIPFSDATSGIETYEVGRFLEIPEPKEKEFTLDFNRCFNPLCNYSPGFNCPIPPLENHLEVPIYAGEKTYPH